MHIVASAIVVGLLVLADSEVWLDDSCPTFIIDSDDTRIEGDLLVSGKLTVMSGVDPSVFEEDSKVHRVSRFAMERCTRKLSHKDGSIDRLVIDGGSNLFVSGALRVGKSTLAASLTVDQGGQFRTGVNLTCDDESLFVPKGLVFLRSGSLLETVGKTVFRIGALDGASTWKSRCGSISTNDHIGTDLMLLGSSVLMFSDARETILNNLMISEASLVNIRSPTFIVNGLVKVSDASVLKLETADVNQLLVETGSRILLEGDLVVKDIVILSGVADVNSQGSAHIKTLELYTQSVFKSRKSVYTSTHCIVDGGSRLTVLDGPLNIDGTLLIANNSQVLASAVETGQDLRLYHGADLETTSRSVKVGCSLNLVERSRLVMVNGTEIYIQMRCKNEPQTNLYVDMSQISAPASNLILNGFEKLAILDMGSTVTLRSYQTLNRTQTTILKSKSQLIVNENQLNAGKLLVLESGSRVRTRDAKIINFENINLGSQTEIRIKNSQYVNIRSLKAKSNAIANIQGDLINIERSVFALQRSTVTFKSPVNFGSEFQQILASGASLVTIEGAASCSSHMTMRGLIMAQDSSIVEINSRIKIHPDCQNFTMTAESNSRIDIACTMAEMPILRRTIESTIKSYSQSLDNVTIYKVQVPHTDSTKSLKSFIDKPSHSPKNSKKWEAIMS